VIFISGSWDLIVPRAFFYCAGKVGRLEIGGLGEGLRIMCCRLECFTVETRDKTREPAAEMRSPRLPLASGLPIRAISPIVMCHGKNREWMSLPPSRVDFCAILLAYGPTPCARQGQRLPEVGVRYQPPPPPTGEFI